MGERLKEKSKTRLDKEKWRINHVILLLCIKLDNYAAKKKKNYNVKTIISKITVLIVNRF